MIAEPISALILGAVVIIAMCCWCKLVDWMMK
jgi:hypothetical protein